MQMEEKLVRDLDDVPGESRCPATGGIYVATAPGFRMAIDRQLSNQAHCCRNWFVGINIAWQRECEAYCHTLAFDDLNACFAKMGGCYENGCN